MFCTLSRTFIDHPVIYQVYIQITMLFDHLAIYNIYFCFSFRMTRFQVMDFL